MIYVLLAAIMAAIVAIIYMTDPFSRISVVKQLYSFDSDQKYLTLVKNYDTKLKQSMLYRYFAMLKCGVHIVASRYLPRPQSNKTNVIEIIKEIHELRFEPSKLLLISGDHFSALFVRNLGVFYYPVLDDRYALSKKSWLRRQQVYLQTVAFALEVFSAQKELTTTIVTTGRRSVTCVNFYAYPSDTLFGILYGLASLSGLETGRPYDYGKRSKLQLITANQAEKLIDENRQNLIDHYSRYRRKVYEESSGLISRSIHMSGAKDITRRESSFYDNVIFWKTTKLAMKLGLIEYDSKYLNSLKKRIVSTFWNEEGGYFLEDLSAESLEEKYYSSDWLIVLSTGFLDMKKRSELKYFLRSVEYVRSQEIDKPFAIKYQNETRKQRQFLPVRLAVASYGGDSIWSFWGMEYIKVLMQLSRVEKENKNIWLSYADYHIKIYKEAMLENGGFPEVYDKHGNLLQTRVYKSIVMTGWVVGFEQVLAIRKTLN